MFVKWHGIKSKSRNLNGGGPQGGTFGILEYLSQSNSNANCVDKDLRWKWVDDLTVLEIINLINIGITSFNAKFQVPNDIDTEKKFIPNKNLLTQTHLDKISDWTKNQKMMLNKKKTNYMIFNFTENYQFNTRLNIESENIEEKKKVKLLGTIISNDLKWDENTSELIKKVNSRMCLLRAVSKFNPPRSDLRTIYIQYIRSIIEQSCILWHSSLSQENIVDIERLQKNACRTILKKSYINYENALDILNLDTLEERRVKLSLTFAKNCRKTIETKDLFKHREKNHIMDLRSSEQFYVNNSNTQRYQNSAVPYMQRLLNKDFKERETHALN